MHESDECQFVGKLTTQRVPISLGFSLAIAAHPAESPLPHFLRFPPRRTTDCCRPMARAAPHGAGAELHFTPVGPPGAPDERERCSR